LKYCTVSGETFSTIKLIPAEAVNLLLIKLSNLFFLLKSEKRRFWFIIHELINLDLICRQPPTLREGNFNFDE